MNKINLAVEKTGSFSKMQFLELFEIIDESKNVGNNFLETICTVEENMFLLLISLKDAILLSHFLTEEHFKDFLYDIQEAEQNEEKYLLYIGGIDLDGNYIEQ